MDSLTDSWIPKTLPFHRVQSMSFKNHWPFHGPKISPSFKSTPDYQLAGTHQSHQRQAAEVIFYSRYFFLAWGSVCSSFPNIVRHFQTLFVISKHWLYLCCAFLRFSSVYRFSFYGGSYPSGAWWKLSRVGRSLRCQCHHRATTSHTT